jgi:hypothetical protein
MPVVFEEVVASVAPEPKVAGATAPDASEPQPASEPLALLLRRQEQRLERLRAD